MSQLRKVAKIMIFKFELLKSS